MHTYHLSIVPLSVNTLYANVAGRGRVSTQRYLTWQRAAMNELMLQQRTPITGNYNIEIVVDKTRRRSNQDLANLEKGVSDVLVKMGILKDDCYADSVKLSWGESRGTTIHIKESKNG